MMDSYGFLSVLPPILAIVLALRTKQVFLSLGLGIWVGWVIIDKGHLLYGTFDSLDAIVKVFADAGNTRTILFTLLVGSLIALIQRSGGVAGFIKWVNSYLNKKVDTSLQIKKRIVQLFASITGLLIFVESNISILTVGTLFRPIFDELKIPREKLAYIADSSSAPSCIIIPFNAWGAYIMGLLMLQDIANPFGLLISSMMYNFYPFLAIIFVFYIIYSGRDFGTMKKAELRAKATGKVLADGAKPMISDEIVMLEAKESVPHRVRNMVIPILAMVIFMPIMLVYTGWGIDDQDSSLGSQVFAAIGNGSGSTSVLYSVTGAILVAFVLFKVQNIMGIKEMVDISLKGMAGMVSLALLMVLAFALGSLCKELGTGQYVAEVAQLWLTPSLVPAIVFVVSCFIAFSTGTSWGTFAIMVSIAIPMAQSMGVPLPLALAAALGGGVFGDHCSPISDTTIISSMASASDHIDHVNTQIPYAMVAGVGAVILYIIIGFVVI